MNRVAVFVDYQNVYKGARRAFDPDNSEPSQFGQVHMDKLGLALTALGRQTDATRALEVVHVYRGQPSSKHDPRGQSACARQISAWRSHPKVHVHPRPLRYRKTGRDRNGDPLFEVQEKGIDVLLAIGMVRGAMEDEFDTAVLFSADTDLIPAVDTVRAIGKKAEVAAWKPDKDGPDPNGLRINGVWCHWLDRGKFAVLEDDQNYARRPRRQR